MPVIAGSSSPSPPSSSLHALSGEEHLRHLFQAVCDYLRLLHTHCKHGPLFDSLAEAQIKAQLRELVRAAMRDRSPPRSHSHPRLELLTTIVSWAIYGAALEWSQRSSGQPAEAFVEEALPLIAASIGAFEDRALRDLEFVKHPRPIRRVTCCVLRVPDHTTCNT